MPVTISHGDTYNWFRSMTLLISYSATGTRIKTRSSSDWTQLQPLVCGNFRVSVPEFVTNQ